MFNWKSDEFGWVSKAKSILVARGFKQREGIDFGEKVAPTVSSSCVRLLSAIACELDLDVCHFDVEQASVQSKLDEDVFLRLPRGCGRLSGKVVRLNKSLYVEASFPVMACASHHVLEYTRFSTVFSGCVRLPFG